MPSYVSPLAPLSVMPSAIEALSGERKAFESGGSALVASRRRSKAKVLAPSTIRRSEGDSVRGSSVRMGGRSPPGPVELPQPVRTSSARETRSRWGRGGVLGYPVFDYLAVYQGPPIEEGCNRAPTTRPSPALP
jgi:hypothetical protein